MELTNKAEHQGCFHNESGAQPTVEIRKLEKGYKEELVFRKNEIAFMIKGGLRFNFRDHPEKVLREGEFIFIPVGGVFRYEVLENARITIIRPNGNVRLCEGFLIEKLYKKDNIPSLNDPCAIHTLEINRPLRLFLEGLNEIAQGGLNCRYYFDIKAKELFILLKAYYTREQLRDFFSLILSPDTVFSEHIRANHHKYKAVKELAWSMNMTQKAFSKKFTKVFGESAMSWMRKEKALSVYSELYAGRETIAQIADKYKFSSQSHLNKFCKGEFGKNPGEIRKGGLNV